MKRGDGAEGARFWLQVFSELKNRGVDDVLIAVCDGLKGLPEAITTITQLGAANQRIALCTDDRDAEDLIQIGAYAPGSNPLTDAAIAFKPRIDRAGDPPPSRRS